LRNLVSVPVDYNPAGPTNPELAESVQKFCTEQFGAPFPFWLNLKGWAVVDKSNGETVAVTTIRAAYDVPMFHVKPSDDREERKEVSEPARNMLVGRLVNYVQDHGGVNQGVFVHIAPEQERLWKAFLRVIHAQPSNRVIVNS
jgi:hypothetical protein